jgi:hypothetical protein
MLLIRYKLSALALPLSASLLSLFWSPDLFAQLNGNTPTNATGQDKYNAITTAVPFLTITPDARSNALGESGSGISPDANSAFYNMAKIAFTEKPFAASLSYTPWLRNLGFTDMGLTYLTGYYKFTKQDAINLQFNYFNLGSLAFTDNSGNAIRDFNPQEIAFGLGYARQLTNSFSVGVSGRYIYSNLTGNFSNTASVDARPGSSIGVDVSGFYKTEFDLGATPAQFNLGFGVTNFGPKISYSNNNRRDFIPTMLRVGPALTLDLDPFNKVTFVLEAAKLLVPTPVRQIIEKQGPSGNIIRIDSITSNKPLFSGIFGSFNDAPGKASEEFNEILLSGGVEYWYDNLFALRAGYFNEAKNKGGRKYFTTGIGIRYTQFGLDISYLVPTSKSFGNPLANTLRFTLMYSFESAAEPASVTDPATGAPLQ